MKTVSATMPADVKAEAAAVAAAHDMSMAALLRELLARVAARDTETRAFSTVNEARLARAFLRLVGSHHDLAIVKPYAG